MSQYRVLLYVQHLLGIGHVKRAIRLAGAMAGRGLQVTLVSGGFEVPGIAAPGVRVVQLPGAAAADLSFKHLIDSNGMVVDDAWKQMRRDALLGLFHETAPHALIIELFPFGRRQMRFELLPLLDAAIGMAPRPLIACSVRDISGGANHNPERQAEALPLVERYFDRILVHGDPGVVSFEHSFAHFRQIAHKIHYTGYVAESEGRPRKPGSSEGAGEVIVSAGGGSFGHTLLMTALRARPYSRLAAATWRVLAGINVPAIEWEALRREAQQHGDGRVLIERWRQDFTTLLANCAVSVSQAGYNTTMEILEAGTRAVVAPFAGGTETEQAQRAEALAARGWLQVVSETDLTPQSLAAAIDRAANAPRPPVAIDMGGAGRSAQLIEEWMTGGVA